MHPMNIYSGAYASAMLASARLLGSSLRLPGGREGEREREIIQLKINKGSHGEGKSFPMNKKEEMNTLYYLYEPIQYTQHIKYSE